MARPGTAPRDAERRIVSCELAGRSIKPIDQDAVGAAIGRDQKAAARIERYVMRMRAGPALIAVRADLARGRDHVGERRQGAVRIDRKHRYDRAIADGDVAVDRVVT